MGFLKNAVDMNAITERAIERDVQKQVDDFMSKAADFIEIAAAKGEYNVSVIMSTARPEAVARIIEEFRDCDYTVEVEDHVDWHRFIIDWS